jgi:hypothetical protein
MYEVRDTRASCDLFGINAFQCRAQFKELEVKSLDVPSATEKSFLSIVKDDARWSGDARILQHKFSDWRNSKTDYARFEDPLIEVGLGSESPGWGWGAAGLEVENVARIKFTLATGGIFKRVGDDGIDSGFKIDYHTPAGYSKRVALSLWNQTPSKYVPVPQWGRAALPDQVEKIGLHRAYDLELARWAPPDWDGKVWFNVMTQNTGSGSRLQVRLVELEKRN